MKQVTPQMDRQMADECSGILAKLRRPESPDALRTIVALPYEQYRHRAAQALRAMGEQTAVPPKAGPVRLQLLDHGRPVSRTEVGVDLYFEGSEYRSISTRLTTDDDGVLSLNRDYFVGNRDHLPTRRARVVHARGYAEAAHKAPCVEDHSDDRPGPDS